MIEQIQGWFGVKAAVLFAAISGAVIHVTIAWSSPAIAARQFLACVLVGINFGPAFVGLAHHYTYLTSPSAEGATICATGLCGVYLTEGLIALGKRWARNPFIPRR